MLHPGGSLSFHSDERSIKSSAEHISSPHSSEPIQIPKRRPRRRLYSEGSVPEEEFGDSGIDSPLHDGGGVRKDFFSTTTVNNVISEGRELDTTTLWSVENNHFMFEDGFPKSHRNTSNVEPCPPQLKQHMSLTLDFASPHDRVSYLRGNSRQFAALCSPARIPPHVAASYRSRSYSQQSTESCSPLYPGPRRERTYSNQSLFSFGTPIHTSSFDVNNAMQCSTPCSTPCHKGRDRSYSDASAPPLPYSLDLVQGYEHTNELHSVVTVPAPPTPLEFHLFFPDEPPPPYEEEDTTANGGHDFREDADVNSLIEHCYAVPSDNHAYNPQWLQAMNITQPLDCPSARNFNEEDAIEALSTFVSTNCCYDNGVTKNMKTKAILPTNGHQYILETYYEERCTSWHQEAYSNQTIDTAKNGTPPVPWSICVARPKMFQQKEIHVEVPHTASLKDCPSCHGKGHKKCVPCYGSGDLKCSICDGLGVLHHCTQEDMSILERRSSSSGCRTCHHCNGGKKTCQSCHGKGQITCTTCHGNGRVKVYIRLTVKWKVLKAHKVLQKTKLPKQCITDVSGTLVFQEQNDRVYPLIDFPEDYINVSSRKMITSHEDQLRHGRIIMQRHCVREVPVTEIRSQWKRQEFTYWVYGNENQVYCPDYPSKCMIGCNIL